MLFRILASEFIAILGLISCTYNIAALLQKDASSFFNFPNIGKSISQVNPLRTLLNGNNQPIEPPVECGARYPPTRLQKRQVWSGIDEQLLTQWEKTHLDTGIQTVHFKNQCKGMMSQVSCVKRLRRQALDRLEHLLKQKSNARIIGGVLANVHDFPWLVSIQSKNVGHFCGGVIISPDWVLTAAHCVVQRNGDFVSQNLLIGHGSKEWRKTTRRDVVKIIAHDAFNFEDFNADIALLKVKPRFHYTRRGALATVPICMYTGREGPLEELVTVAGWGTTVESQRPKPTDELRTVDLRILNDTYCSLYSSFNTNTKLCAGRVTGGQDSCQGDSGGPLLTMLNGRMYQIGIISYGEGCAKPGYPGVYTKVKAYLGWIRKHTGLRF